MQHSSNQVRLGQEKFTSLVRHAYDSGITYFDTADQYGSHIFLRDALKKLPREKLFIQTKTRAQTVDVAKADLDRALEIDPDHPSALTRRATLRLLEGESFAALTDCDQALEADPDNLQARILRGMARWEAGFRDGAMEDFDVPAAVKLYRAAVPDAGFLEAHQYAIRLAEVERARYRTMRIDRVAEVVRMAKKLDELTREGGWYPRVIAYGDPEQAVAALTRIGESYVTMADAMRRAPLPKGLTEEQLDLYIAELEAQIVVLQTRAIDAFELALARGREFSVSGRWMAAASTGPSSLRLSKLGKLLGSRNGISPRDSESRPRSWGRSRELNET